MSKSQILPIEEFNNLQSRCSGVDIVYKLNSKFKKFFSQLNLMEERVKNPKRYVFSTFLFEYVDEMQNLVREVPFDEVRDICTEDKNLSDILRGTMAYYFKHLYPLKDVENIANILYPDYTRTDKGQEYVDNSSQRKAFIKGFYHMFIHGGFLKNNKYYNNDV